MLQNFAYYAAIMIYKQGIIYEYIHTYQNNLLYMLTVLLEYIDLHKG